MNAHRSIGAAAKFAEFPWDTIRGAKARAAAHADGIVDLSIGTPVDPAPAVAQSALIAAADAHQYPTVWGPETLRLAVCSWLERRFGLVGIDPEQVLPTIGSKEFIANLGVQAGVGTTDIVGIPELAYPTYRISAEYVSATVIATDSVLGFGPKRPRIIFLNSPANPHGQIFGVDHLRTWVEFARSTDALVVSDECYAEFVWEGEYVSVLDRRVNGGSFDNILAVHSLSKRSNLAGYRDGFVVGDQRWIAALLAVRKHLGFMLPTPVAAAMEAALGDDRHVDAQVERYAARRAILRSALFAAGFEITHSQGSLYLWATRGEPGRATVDWLADRGILVAPGDFYGTRGSDHVRVAFTASDERISAAAERLRT